MQVTSSQPFVIGGLLAGIVAGGLLAVHILGGVQPRGSVAQPAKVETLAVTAQPESAAKPTHAAGSVETAIYGIAMLKPIYRVS